MDNNEKLGQAIDRLENITYSIELNLPAETHVKQLKEILPSIVQELKEGFIKLTNENPWE